MLGIVINVPRLFTQLSSIAVHCDKLFQLGAFGFKFKFICVYI